MKFLDDIKRIFSKTSADIPNVDSNIKRGTVTGDVGFVSISDSFFLQKLLGYDGIDKNYSISELEGISAVFACVRALSSDLASIPLDVLSRDDKRTKQTGLSSYNIIAIKPAYYQTKSVFWSSFWWNVFIGGKGFAQILRDSMGFPISLRLHQYNEVSVVKDELTYKVYFLTKEGYVPYEDMIYLPINSRDGVVGRSCLQVASETFKEGKSMQEHGVKFYENGAKLPGILTVPSRLEDAPGNTGKNPNEKAANARERLRENFSSSTSSGRVPILEQGVTFQPLNMPLGDAQFIETRNLSFDQVCSIFGVPPTVAQKYTDAKYTSSEQMDLGYVKHTLSPYMTMFEDELLTKLVPQNKWQKVEVYADMDYMLRGDLASLTNYQSAMLDRGVLTRNDILRAKKIPTFEGGDERWMVAGYMPEETAKQYYGQQGTTNTGD